MLDIKKTWYSSKDGNVYDNEYDARAANRRYEQQERMISQLEKQNSILEKQNNILEDSYSNTRNSNISNSSYTGQSDFSLADIILAILTLPFRPLINKLNDKALAERHKNMTEETDEEIELHFSSLKDREDLKK